MKIDAFSLDLSSSRTYSQTQTTQFSQSFSFVDLMDSRMGGGPVTPAGSGMLAGWSVSAMVTASPWVMPVSLEGQPAVSLTDRFMAELTSMRQIMAAVMDQLSQRMPVSGVCRITQVGQIYMMPVSMGSMSMTRAWEATRQMSVTYGEAEQTTVTAGGTVQTADNREIAFSLDLAMEREFFHENTIEQTATGYVLVDPLVVRTDAEAPLFGGGQFSFDLDLDGTDEDLPLPGPGWGFLSLDLNGDGIINDGSELFGPATGDGFSELAEYDLDHNQWIDENDGIFDQLTLWEQGEEGMTLTRIKDAGIGAIYLAGIPSQFDLTSSENELLGQVTKTSVALAEDGTPLAVQEVDYVVPEGEEIA